MLTKKNTSFPRDVPVVPTQDAVQVDLATLNRSQVAQILGLSTSGVRVLERQGLLRPTVGPRGVLRFRREQVEELAQTRNQADAARATLELTRKRAREFDADTFRAVATRLRDGMTPLDVVMECGVTPDAFWSIVEQFTWLSGAFVVLPAQAREIGSVTSGAGVVETVQYLRDAVQKARSMATEARKRATGTDVGMFLLQSDRAALERILQTQLTSSVDVVGAVEAVLARRFTCTRSGVGLSEQVVPWE